MQTQVELPNRVQEFRTHNSNHLNNCITVRTLEHLLLPINNCLFWANNIIPAQTVWSAGHSLNNRFFWALQTCDWDYNFNCGLLFLNLIPAFVGLGLDNYNSVCHEKLNKSLWDRRRLWKILMKPVETGENSCALGQHFSPQPTTIWLFLGHWLCAGTIRSCTGERDDDLSVPDRGMKSESASKDEWGDPSSYYYDDELWRLHWLK